MAISETGVLQTSKLPLTLHPLVTVSRPRMTYMFLNWFASLFACRCRWTQSTNLWSPIVTGKAKTRMNAISNICTVRAEEVVVVAADAVVAVLVEVACGGRGLE